MPGRTAHSAGRSPSTEASRHERGIFGFKGFDAGGKPLAVGHDDDVAASGDLVATENLSYQTFSTIAPHGAAQLSGGRDAETPRGPAAPQQKQRGEAAVDADAALVHQLEVRSAANPLVRPEFLQVSRSERLVRAVAASYSLLTVRRFRPLARRRFRTRRPFFVLMRTRNPCVRL